MAHHSSAEARSVDVGSPTCKVTIHCLAGSSFPLDVSAAETVLDVSKRIALKVGRPAGALILTSGGAVLDKHKSLLQQVKMNEVTYVVQKFGAGCAARSWKRALSRQDLQLADASALDEIVSLHENTGRILADVQLPSNLQTLTFGDWVKVEPQVLLLKT